MAAAEVGEFVVFNGLHVFNSFVELRVHGLSAGLEALVFGGHFARFQFLEHLAVGSGGDVREGGHGLELRRAFVNGGDAGVAVEALAGVFEHVAGTAVNLYAVVGVQVRVFGVHALRKRSASGGELLVTLEFSFFLVGELAGAFDVLEALVDIHVAGCLVQACAACVEACAVHEGHHVLDETELAAAAEFSLGVLVDKFAGRASVDAELVLDAANVHAAVALVIDEHGKTTSIMRAFFGAGEHQVDVGVTVGDEALHAVLIRPFGLRLKLAFCVSVFPLLMEIKNNCK